FRKHHILKILNEFSDSTLPLDVFLRFYLKKNKALGSKDRQYIADTIYKIIRFKGFLDYFIKDPITWEKRLEALFEVDFEKKQSDSSIPLHIRLSFPEVYFEKIKSSYGEKQAVDFCKVSNNKACTTIRTNTLKISRDELFKKFLEKNCLVEKTQNSSEGIRFLKKENFFSMQEFKLGYFEIQDEASQMVSFLIDVKPKEHILDYCAGAGGKSLAYAPKMLKKGQIYLYDIRDFALKEAKKRFKRAGIENFQIITSEKLNRLTNKMDKVILDVPCSGSGTLMRNPDMKWRFKLENQISLIETQRNIFSEGIKYLKPGGKIIYITCSIFPDENEKQVEYFINKYSLKEEKRFFTFPKTNLHDGFFGSVLKR
ncbi:MAG: RsmB/NOP family class I SAM-dependent RNA methyltransferase, partial [Parachlamydiales bacterium]|nr:RsmB/NOP family class I SAM-dependent RNA methyltransferase [Parachlamydiales bacterium]